MAYYLAIKTNKVLIYSATLMNPENLLNERSQWQKKTHTKLSYLSEMSKIHRFTKTEVY